MTIQPNVKTFKRRATAAKKSYRNGSETIKNLIHEGLLIAQDNNFQTVYLQMVLDGMEGSDINDVALIITKMAPLAITEGHISKAKSKKVKDRGFVIDEALFARHKSFRTLATELRGAPKESKPFDLDKYAQTVLKRLISEGVDLNKFTGAVEKAASESKAKA